MIAKLVRYSFVTRVVVPEDATDEDIVKASQYSMLEKVASELNENLEEIVDDLECPEG